MHMHEAEPANDPVPPPPSTTLRLAVPLQDHLGVPDGTILVALADDAHVELDLDGDEAVDLADVLTSLNARCAVRIHHVEPRWDVAEPVHLAASVLERALAGGSWGSPGATPDGASANASESEEIAAGMLGSERAMASAAEAAVRLSVDPDGEALRFASSTGVPGAAGDALRDGLEQALALVRCFQGAYARTTRRRVRLATMVSLPPVVPAAVTGSDGDGDVDVVRTAVLTGVPPTRQGPPLDADELAELREAFTDAPPWQAFAVAEELGHALNVAIAEEDLLTAVLLAPAMVEAALREAALVLLWRAGVAPATARAVLEVETVGEVIDDPIVATHDWSDEQIEQLRWWSDQLLIYRDRALRWGQWPSRSQASMVRWSATRFREVLRRSFGIDLVTDPQAFEEWRAAVAAEDTGW